MKNLFNRAFFRRINKKPTEPLVEQYKKQQNPNYWHWKARKEKLRFWFANQAFRIREWHTSGHQDFSDFRILIRVIWFQFLLAFVIIASLEGIEYILQHYIQVPVWGMQFPTISAEAYWGLAGELIGLTGAFIALYFTAVAVVVSTVYAEVSDDVRRLLVRHMLGSFYFRALATLGVMAVLISGVLALGYVPGILNLIVIVFLAAFSILSFVILGMQVLDFFNPTPLLGLLNNDFYRLVVSATPSGWRWQEPAFQAHYQQQAENSVQTFRNVMDLITTKKGMGRKPISHTLFRILSLLQSYAFLKTKIPTKSRWFRQVGEFQDWLLAGHAELTLALSTGTEIQQKIVPNPLWVEEDLSYVLKLGICELLDKQDWQQTLTTINHWQITLQVFSTYWGITEAEYFLYELEDIVQSQVIKPDEMWLSGQRDLEELGMRLAILDIYHLGFIQIVLGFARQIDNMTLEEFSSRIEQIDWTKHKDIYKTGMPRAIVTRLETLQANLSLEIAAEGKIVTPLWYLQQVLVVEFANYTIQTVKQLVQQIDKLFIKEAEKLTEKKSTIFAAQTCGRGIEAVAKGKLCLRNARKCLEQLYTFVRPFSFHLINIKWPQIEWDELEQQLNTIHENLLIIQGKTIPVLMTLPKSKFLPDMFGRITTELAHGCFNALLHGKEVVFSQQFKAYFIAGLVAYQRLAEQLQDYEDWIKLNFSIEPILHLMEISGYALIYTELGRGNFWEPVKHQWDWYLSDPETSDFRLNMLENFVNYKNSQFGFNSSDLIRTGWKQSFSSHMRSLGINALADDLVYTHFDTESHLEEYPPIVQAVIEMPFCDLRDAFTVVYFDNRKSNTFRFNLPRQARRFRKGLERRQNREHK
jgi:hypothetical protein